MQHRLNRLCTVVLLGLLGSPVGAVEVIPASELAAHCRAFLDGSENERQSYCAHYVQGFIDGAVTTDVRVMLNVEAEYATSKKRKETLTERAIRTRMPGFTEQQSRAANYAEFCLGNPVPLREVVAGVAQYLNSADADLNGPARDAVYSALRRHYPC